MSRKDEIKKLLSEHQRSLQKLKEKQASYGFVDTPVRILKEIEDTEEAIEKLEMELESLDDTQRAENSSSQESNNVWGISQVWWVPIIVALIGLIGVLIPSIVNNDSTPTPPSSFEYAVRVEDRVTGKPIPRAQITIEVINQAPLREITDSGGNARFFINPERSGQPGRLLIQATGYGRHTQNIDLMPDQLPNVVLLVTP